MFSVVTNPNAEKQRRNGNERNKVARRRERRRTRSRHPEPAAIKRNSPLSQNSIVADSECCMSGSTNTIRGAAFARCPERKVRPPFNNVNSGESARTLPRSCNKLSRRWPEILITGSGMSQFPLFS